MPKIINKPAKFMINIIFIWQRSLFVIEWNETGISKQIIKYCKTTFSKKKKHFYKN